MLIRNDESAIEALELCVYEGIRGSAQAIPHFDYKAMDESDFLSVVLKQRCLEIQSQSNFQRFYR